MKRALLILAIASSFAKADNCYVWDRSTQDGERSYESCKDQARQMDDRQAAINHYIDQSNRRNESNWNGAQQEQTNMQLQEILRQLQTNNQ